MKNRRDILIITGLFAALILFIGLGPGRQPQASDPAQATTHSSAPEGALALYSWTRDLGYDSRRLEYRAFALDESDAALIIPPAFSNSRKANGFWFNSVSSVGYQNVVE